MVQPTPQEQRGHLFQGRYKAILIERDSYFLELARYIVLNPVRAAKAPPLMGVEQLRSDDRNLPSSEMA